MADRYELKATVQTPTGIDREFRPIISDEERARRYKVIQDGTAQFMKAVDRAKMQKGTQKEGA